MCLYLILMCLVAVSIYFVNVCLYLKYILIIVSRYLYQHALVMKSNKNLVKLQL